MNLENTIKKASQALKNKKINSHVLDAEIILSDIMGVEREFLTTNNKNNISKKIKNKYALAIKRRIKNEPVAYIIGKKEFWSQNFTINQKTLIPRPESELIIYKLVNYYKQKNISILDIGTGSGCILLSLLKELKQSRGLGIDVSPGAIKIAQMNSQNLNLNARSKFKVIDFKDFNIGKYDLIVSNPPYIALKDIKNLARDIIRYEPLVALRGGFDGLEIIRKVIYKSKYLIKKNGLLAIEIGTNQYIKVSEILKKNGFREINNECDFNKNVRCIISTYT